MTGGEVPIQLVQVFGGAPTAWPRNLWSRLEATTWRLCLFGPTASRGAKLRTRNSCCRGFGTLGIASQPSIAENTGSST
jgi:hypothetical protein